MLIDWFTVGAQILNFLILVWLLKRYLYKPILGAIDAREKKITALLAKGATLKAEAEAEHATYEAKNREIATQRDALLAKAGKEAEAERQKLLAEARSEGEALRKKRGESLKAEATALKSEITRRAQKEVFAIARKTLTDLASETLEERVASVFIGRLKALDDGDKERLKSPDEAVVRSAFALPEAQRILVESALKSSLEKADLKVEFETAPDLVSGIELTIGANKVAWSIADYLASLERSVAQALSEGELRPATPKGPESQHAQ